MFMFMIMIMIMLMILMSPVGTKLYNTYEHTEDYLLKVFMYVDIV